MTEQDLFSGMKNTAPCEILHIEIGAGKGNFGKRYYPECLLTDKSPHYKEFHIDLVCDAVSIPRPDKSFNKIISCNPFHYGFRYIEEGSLLLKEFFRILKSPGEIIIIGSQKNPYCTSQNVEKCLRAFSVNGIKSIYSKIDSSVLFSGYTFYREDGRVTRPDLMVSINVD